jgi:hypothetical protein
VNNPDEIDIDIDDEDESENDEAGIEGITIKSSLGIRICCYL